MPEDNLLVGGTIDNGAINMCHLGRIAEYQLMRKSVWLDTSGAHAVYVMGKRRSGKTFTLGVLAESLASTGWIINWVWFSFLVSWLIKLIILKYGGIKNYRKAVPFFIGLILGEFVVGCFWEILGLSMGIGRYRFYDA